MISDKTEFDISHPLYGKNCVFTGTLEKMSRKEAMQIVADFGGINSDSVTKKTNFLVLGNNDYSPLIKDGKSNKQKKAEKLKLEGCDIDIMPENVFYDLANIDLESPADKQKQQGLSGRPISEGGFNQNEIEVFEIVSQIISENKRDCTLVRCKKNSSNILCISIFADIIKVKMGGKNSYVLFDKYTDLSGLDSSLETEQASKSENTSIRIIIYNVNDIKKLSDIIVKNYDIATEGNRRYIECVAHGQKNYEDFLKSWYC